jgi:chemotaxis protein MotA
MIKQILEIAGFARQEGILALEAKVATLEHPFLMKALNLVVDNADHTFLDETLDNEIYMIKERHDTGRKVVEFLASVVPAFGMIGTLIGLVQMLRNLENPATIGPSMAVAMITTFYGAMAANLFFTPLARKLEFRSAQERFFLQIIQKGCLLIAGGVSPKLIEESLLSNISRTDREAYVKAKESGKEAAAPAP